MKNGYISTLVKNIMSKYYPFCWFVSYAMVEFNVYKGSNALSVLIGAEKQDIGTIFPYLDILQSFGLREKSLAHTKTLFTAYGYDTAFGRGNVMALLGLTASPASELPRKLLAVNVIYLVKGMGKGRYRFAPAKAQHGMF